MDAENQGLIKKLADQLGTEELVVILGAADAEAVEVAVETVREGDPAYIGPLAGVQLGLPVYHVLEDAIRGAVEPGVYEQHLGLFALSFDTDAITEAMERSRGDKD
jgi:glycine/sarcosine/betaine reductase complex component A